MSLTRKQWILIVSGVVILLALILVVTFGLKRTAFQSVSLNFWGVDEPAIWEELIAEYKSISPHVEITYTKIDSATYEQDLVNGLAGPAGPDVFMFQNSWLPKHIDKAAPIDTALLNTNQFNLLFPTVAEQDFFHEGAIYALPLFIDTLALYYNQDLFDKYGIALPPKSWLDFQEIAKKLPVGSVAMGGSGRNIERATDILNLLFLQSGIEMVAPDFNQATFSYQGGVEPLTFYTKFSAKDSPFYVWNNSQPNALDAFVDGQVAMMFDYLHRRPLIQQLVSERNPSLRFAVAPMLQSAGRTVNYPFYYGLTVSAQTPHREEAWKFILYVAANPEASLKYLESVEESPALRSLIDELSSDPEVGVFSRQALTARSWPQIDNVFVERIFSEMLELIIAGTDPQLALDNAQEQINQLMYRKRR